MQGVTEVGVQGMTEVGLQRVTEVGVQGVTDVGEQGAIDVGFYTIGDERREAQRAAGIRSTEKNDEGLVKRND